MPGITDILAGGLLAGVKGIINSIKLDPEKKAELQSAIDAHEATFKLKELELNGEIQKQISAQVLAQIEVNKTDAQGGWFQSGWRPSAGYASVIGLVYQFLGWPLLSWVSGIFHYPPPPALDMGTLITILGGMLGLGALRTQEKLKDKD